jgi:ribosomal protein L4
MRTKGKNGRAKKTCKGDKNPMNSPFPEANLEAQTSNIKHINSIKMISRKAHSKNIVWSEKDTIQEFHNHSQSLRRKEKEVQVSVGKNDGQKNWREWRQKGTRNHRDHNIRGTTQCTLWNANAKQNH